MKTKWICILTIILPFLLQAQPDWFKKPPTDKYPSSAWLMGLGSSEKGYDGAVDAAMSDLSKQVKAFVKTRSVSKKSSTTIAGNEQIDDSFREASMVYSNIELKGTEVAAREKSGDKYYAMVVLEKARYAAILMTDIRQLNDEITHGWNTAKKDATAGNIAEAIPNLLQVRKKIFLAQNKLDIYETVAGPDSTLNVPVKESDVAEVIRSIVNNISLKVVGESKIQAKAGAPIGPLKVKLTDNKSVPLKRIPIAFSVVGKKAKPVIRYTDENGMAEYSGYPEHKGGRHIQIKALPALPVPSKMGKNLAAALTVMFDVNFEQPADSHIGLVVTGEGLQARGGSAFQKILILEFKKHHIIAQPGKANTTLQVNFSGEKLADMTSMRRLVRISMTAVYSLYKGSQKINGFIRESEGMGSNIKQAARKAMKGLLPTAEQYNLILSASGNEESRKPNSHSRFRVGDFDFVNDSRAPETNISGKLRQAVLAELEKRNLLINEADQRPTRSGRNAPVKRNRAHFDKNPINQIDKIKNDSYIVFGIVRRTNQNMLELTLKVQKGENQTNIPEIRESAPEINDLLSKIPGMIEKLSSF